ncbi:MAG TPA: metallophosphoesterase [Candidatus Acidoferrum sp.]|nr:metallophosphoesterase [Candidatus Acidoferrum sp.]
MTRFLTIVLSIWSAMHVYVFWRLSSVPWVSDHLSRTGLAAIALALWACYPVARVLEAWKLEAVARPVEFIGATWIGVIFLLVAALLATDVATLGGWVLPQLAPRIRGLAALAAGLLAVVALVQGLRAPAVRDYEVRLPGLPAECDALVLVQLSDLHLGTLIGRGWMDRLARRVNKLRPDLIALVGDVVDGNIARAEGLQPVLATLQARLGVWAVTGNHEYYAGVQECVRLFEHAGFNVLRNRCAEVAPGLVLAGVDDLTARSQFKLDGRPFEQALANRPPGGVILLSHTPWAAEVAAQSGAGLMLCGHTHAGQLWPFNYLVRRRYPMLAGRYEVCGMPLIVCRGTGTWGPRMRLWKPGEIVRITLRYSIANSQSNVAARDRGLGHAHLAFAFPCQAARLGATNDYLS